MSEGKKYNPDVLNCIANLSNDEVFTSPDLANKMLDLLPQELFKSREAKFLDPFTKSGVFLREIAKRLIKGLEDEIPDLQERIDHIMHNQLYGIAITELTSLLTRRSLYCSKYPNCRYSISKFSTVEGNIRFKRVEHTWKDGKCVFCGASKKEYDRAKDLETHAYELIHVNNPKEIFNMKFDLIIGNPPYQLSDGGNSASASPLYHLFVEQAIKLQPKYLSMIIPARWYAGGKGLDEFRENMLNQNHISAIVDYPNSADCFPNVNVAGGICYFLWEKDYSGLCNVYNFNEQNNVQKRKLNEFKYFVRSNIAVSIIRKIKKQNEKTMDKIVYSRNYFNIPTTITNDNNGDVDVLTSKGYIKIIRDKLSDSENILNKHKIVITYAMSGGNKPSSDGKYQIISSLQNLGKNKAFSETYLLIKAFDDENEALNLCNYISTKFFRFLLLQALSSIHITKDKFCFIPQQDFSNKWTDKELYKKYEFTNDEINYIESLIKPMNNNGGDLDE